MHFCLYFYRSDPSVIERLARTCYAVLKVSCDGRRIREARIHQTKFMMGFIPTAMFWSRSQFKSENWVEAVMIIRQFLFISSATLTLKFRSQLSYFAAISDGTLWTQFLLRVSGQCVLQMI